MNSHAIFVLCCALAFAHPHNDTDAPTTTSSVAAEESSDGFSKWDGIGLIVSVCLILFGALCLALTQCKDHHDETPKLVRKDSKHADQQEMYAPDLSKVEPYVKDVFNKISSNGLKIRAKDLRKVYSKEEVMVILDDHDMDRTGDLSHYELSRFVKSQEEADKILQKFKNLEADEEKVEPALGETVALEVEQGSAI